MQCLPVPAQDALCLGSVHFEAEITEEYPTISVFPLASLSISGTFLLVDWFRVSVSSVNTATSVLSPTPSVLGYYSFAYVPHRES